MIHDLSLGEVQSLALKATRGAGRSFGIAEEGAFAVRWLTERGYDGAGHLAALLEAGDASERCPLQLGAAWSDLACMPEEDVATVVCPMLLLPFLPGLCLDGSGLSLRAGSVTVRVSGDGDVAGDAVPTGLADVILERCAPPNARPRHTRAQVDDTTLATLTAFAFRTYAPVTEASRARGAGAGLSDND